MERKEERMRGSGARGGEEEQERWEVRVKWNEEEV